MAAFFRTVNILGIMFGLFGKYESLAEKVDRSQRLSRDEASVLAGAPLALLGLLASRVKERKSGREVYYNRNFHIEPTNICVFNCRFCSYRRPAGASDTAIAAVLSRSPMTVKRSLNELENAGLIMRVRQGVGEPNRIYVLIPGKEDAALA